MKMKMVSKDSNENKVGKILSYVAHNLKWNIFNATISYQKHEPSGDRSTYLIEFKTAVFRFHRYYALTSTRMENVKLTYTDIINVWS